VAGVYDARAAQEAQKAREQQRRQQILAQTHGGHNGIKGFTTNFEAAGGLHNLKNMIDNAQPDALDHVVTRWEAINTALSTAQQDLIKHTAAALQTWSGPAAQQFNQRSAQLQQSLGNAAEYATQTASAVREAATALRTAKTQMDGIHDAGFWDKASRWGATSDSQFKADLKSGIDLGTALQLDGSQLNAEEQRHQQAVLVMEQLGAGYNNSSNWLSKNLPPKDNGGNPVYPPTPPTTHQPVTRPGGTATSPRNEAVTPGSISGGGQRIKGAGDVSGLTPNSGAGLTGAGTVSPVSGGTVGKLPNAPVTSVDGVTGGIPVASGSSGLTGGAGGVAGLGGLGAGGGGGIGGGSLAGLGVGAAGLGEAGRLGGSLAGEGAAGEGSLAAERALAEESAAGHGEGAGANGMMGGMGGLGRGNGRKNKRKQRAAYLVEDEETWEQGVTPNPPVIG
jgi:uncharacterized protein YukE